jgi:hypothetical protein
MMQVMMGRGRNEAKQWRVEPPAWKQLETRVAHHVSDDHV